jgi:hypothetical protein
MSEINEMTTAELKEYAADNDIDLGGAKTKTRILAAIQGFEASIGEAEPAPLNVISAPGTGVKPSGVPRSNVRENDSGILTSAAADRSLITVPTETPPKPEIEKVAVHSTRNIRWQGVGSLNRGYNIVNKEVAEKWLTRPGVREATAKEVATYYGK